MPKSQTSTLQSPAAAPAPAFPALTRLVRLFLWRRRCRRELADLSPEQMRDVGLDPEAVRLEVRKPFWQA